MEQLAKKQIKEDKRFTKNERQFIEDAMVNLPRFIDYKVKELQQL